MSEVGLFERYRELQAYVGWTEEDGLRVGAVSDLLAPHLPALIDDFYRRIERHPRARNVITGGQPQIDRLKGTLLQWVTELLSGRYDEDYVARRWRVGWRHVEIGLEQVYTNVALSRLRTGLCQALQENWGGDPRLLVETVRSLNALLDLDLAIIEEAYQSEYTARLQSNERLATLGQVAGGVAHELRNPLNVMKTSVYYLLNARSATQEKMAEHFHRIARQVDIADGVITTLLNFARLPVANLGPIPIGPSVRDSLRSNPPGSSIRVTIDLEDSLPHALADVDQLRIVFGNLIRNACDAMTRGGELKIQGRRVGGSVEVDIADTGVGIPRADLSRILEPLYSTKARGLGLGLAIVRAILDKSGGELRVESEPGHGSIFTVTLMAAPGARAAE